MKKPQFCPSCGRDDVSRNGKVTGHGIVGKSGQEFCPGSGKPSATTKRRRRGKLYIIGAPRPRNVESINIDFRSHEKLAIAQRALSVLMDAGILPRNVSTSWGTSNDRRLTISIERK